MLEQGEILTLDDNKRYVVVYVIELDSKNYVYLIDEFDYTNTMICEYDNNNGLVEVVDKDLIEKILLKYNEIKNS